MAMTFAGQRLSCKSKEKSVEKTGQCAKEEVSSSLLGKPAGILLCTRTKSNRESKSNIISRLHYNIIMILLIRYTILV